MYALYINTVLIYALHIKLNTHCVDICTQYCVAHTWRILCCTHLVNAISYRNGGCYIVHTLRILCDTHMADIVLYVHGIHTWQMLYYTQMAISCYTHMANIILYTHSERILYHTDMANIMVYTHGNFFITHKIKTWRILCCTHMANMILHTYGESYGIHTWQMLYYKRMASIMANVLLYTTYTKTIVYERIYGTHMYVCIFI